MMYVYIVMLCCIISICAIIISGKGPSVVLPSRRATGQFEQGNSCGTTTADGERVRQCYSTVEYIIVYYIVQYPIVCICIHIYIYV